jgi:ATP-dependent helicase HrpB
MLRYPLHPRAARVLVAAHDLGLGALGPRLAAALTEGSPFRRGTARERPRQPSDVLEWALAVGGPRDDASLAREGLDPMRARAMSELSARLARAAPRDARRVPEPADEEAAALAAIAAGYPDRLARVRPPPVGGTRHRPELLFASGGSAELDALESTWSGDLCVVIELEQRAQGRASAPLVRAASSVSEDWLLLERTSDVRDVVTLSLDEASGAVVELRRMTLGALVLEETKGPPRDLARAREVLADALLARGPEVLGDAREAAFRLAGRLETARAHVPEAGLPSFDDGLLRRALVHAAAVSPKVSDVLGALRASLYELSLEPSERALLDELCPEHVTIGAGRRARLEYAPGKPPSLASRMQDFFGARDGPRVCRGRLPVVLELLAPNGRAVQVTTDLSGFWDRHYTAIARELRRKYPRHPFPDDPRAALPPAPRRRP